MRSLPAASMVLLLASCHAPRLACTLVHLRTGEHVPATLEERQQLFGGHFANMERMAKEGQLLVAGPYGTEKHAADLRGIFILDTADREAARSWAETDPTTRAGVFRLEYHDLVTDAPLRACRDREVAKLLADQAAGRQPPPGDGVRAYVLLIAADRSRAAAELGAHDAVVLAGDHDAGGWLAVLDADNLPAARDKLGAALDRIGPHTLDEWWSSSALAHLRSPD